LLHFHTVSSVPAVIKPLLLLASLLFPSSLHCFGFKMLLVSRWLPASQLFLASLLFLVYLLLPTLLGMPTHMLLLQSLYRAEVGTY
jgi:hypothetical protein